VKETMMAKMEVQAEEKPKQVLAQLGRDGEGGVLNLGFSNPLHCAREKHDGPLFALLLLLCVWKGHKRYILGRVWFPSPVSLGRICQPGWSGPG
jgi:hypothetical protein